MTAEGPDVQNVIAAWSALDNTRRVIVGLASVALLVIVIWIVQIALKPGMSLLYSGLDPAAAGDVVAALEAKNVPYEVRGAGIYVEASQRDSLRMALAGEGLPASGAAGYELLDGLTGFGTTSQMFDAAYWRAKEGELARTLVASPYIRTARVHISSPSSTPFQRGGAASASVFVTPARGTLTTEQGEAIRHLVASAVAGLPIQDVSVIDGQTGVVLQSPGNAALMATGDGKRAEALKQSVKRLLEARVGPGNAIVEVSLETQTERESIVERTIDPDSRIAISTESEERTNSSQGQAGGSVTVASNLPDGDAGTEGQGNSAQSNESRERVNFDVSEIQREVQREPGAIRRLTVAVLVNGFREIDASGAEVFNPRSADELEDLRALVASAVGFDAARGDEITIRSMALEPLQSDAAGSAPAMGLLRNLDLMTLIQLGVFALVTLALGLFVVRPLLSGGSRSALAAELPAPDGTSPGLPAPPPMPDLAELDGGPALTGEIDDGALPEMNMIGDFSSALGDGGDFPALGDDSGADPVARLKSLIEERQEETVEVLRSWMEDKPEGA